MATDFKYAGQSDLEMYFPAYSQIDVKRQIFNFIDTETGTIIADDILTHNTSQVDHIDKFDVTSTTGKIKQKGAFMQSSTHQALVLGY